MAHTGKEIGVLYGHYDDRAHLEESIRIFKNSGFPGDAVSVLLANAEESEEFAHERGIDTPSSTMLGTGSGALIGGALGYIAGITSLAITGGGIILIAGPLVGLLAGAGVGRALEGLRGAFAELGLSYDQIAHREALVRQGHPMMVIHCLTHDHEQAARRILEETGATEVGFSPNKEFDRDISPYR